MNRAGHGDLVLLKQGYFAPDLVDEANNLEVNESQLTGETLLYQKVLPV